MDTEVVNQSTAICCRWIRTRIPFLLLAEYKNPMSSPGYDHLGLLQDTREEVDELLAKCKEYQKHDRPGAHQGVRGSGQPDM